MSLLWTARVRMLGYFFTVKNTAVSVSRSLRETCCEARDIWRKEKDSDKTEQLSNGELKKTKAQLIRLSATVCGIEFCYAAETGKFLFRLRFWLTLLLTTNTLHVSKYGHRISFTIAFICRTTSHASLLPNIILTTFRQSANICKTIFN